MGAKIGAARAHDHRHPAFGDPLPVPIPVGVAQVAVQHGDGAEAAAKTLDGLRRETDLRHQHDRLPAVAHHLFDRLDIDLRLAAAGHAVDQQRAMLLRTQRGEHGVQAPSAGPG